MTRRRMRRGRGDQGSAMLMAVLLIMVMGGFGLVVLGATMAQVKPTSLARKGVRTVHAAEAGIDVGLARIRAARTASGKGDRTRLPCGSADTPAFTGSVGPDAGSLRYRVVIRYFAANPAGQSESWRAKRALTCSPVSGTAVTPRYALLESVGTGTDVPGTVAGSGNRTIESIYDFAISNANVAGGLIEFGDSNYCIRATGGSGTLPAPALCNASDPAQIWAYREDLTLVLVSTLTTGIPLCLDAANGSAGSVSLRTCDRAAWMRQAWAYNDWGRFEGPTAAGGTNGWCFEINLPTPEKSTSLVTRKNCIRGVHGDDEWVPDTQVGAGAAGTDTGRPSGNGQLVNYREFARCFDITNQDMDWPWLIAYPCKQAVDPTQVRWNQRLQTTPRADGTFQLWTAEGSDKRCVTAGDGKGAPKKGDRVLMRACDPSLAAQAWTFTGVSTSYADSYTIVSNDLCLSLVPSPEKTGSLAEWSMVVVDSCDGSTNQKWNAPADLQSAGQRDTREVWD